MLCSVKEQCTHYCNKCKTQIKPHILILLLNAKEQTNNSCSSIQEQVKCPGVKAIPGRTPLGEKCRSIPTNAYQISNPEINYHQLLRK